MLPWARKGYASGRLRRCWGSAWTTSLAALTLATILGVPLAWLLARRDLFAKALVRALCVLPIIGIVVAAVQAGKPPPGSGARRYRERAPRTVAPNAKSRMPVSAPRRARRVARRCVDRIDFFRCRATAVLRRALRARAVGEENGGYGRCRSRRPRPEALRRPGGDSPHHDPPAKSKCGDGQRRGGDAVTD